MSATIIRYRDATSVSDFVYLRAEVIYDKDAGTLAVSDGVTAYSALPKFYVGTGGLTDGTYGDIVISGGGAVMTVANGAVTLAKLADLAADRIMGRANGAGTGAPQALTAAQVKAILALAIADVSGLQAALDAKENNWTYASLGSDFTTTSATAVDVTGLAFAPAASTNYEFEAMLMVRTATGAVGPRPGLSWPTGLTEGVGMMFVPQAANADLLSYGNSNAALLVAAGGLPSTTLSYMGGGRGFVFAGASPSGNVQVQLASETAGTTVTIKAGSFLRWRIIP